jgi:hypothetical protein
MMMSIGMAIYAIFVTAFVLYLSFQLIDSERQRKFRKELKRREIEQDFNKQMNEIRSDWGGERFGEVRMTVKKNRKNKSA